MTLAPSLKASRADTARIALFNHKGGVGKTTLTVNVAKAVANAGFRVLVVDSDPQCNLTSLLVEESVVNDLLDKSDTEEGRTVWSALKPVAESEGDARLIAPYELPAGMFLLPGDIRLAEFEQELTTMWGDCFQRKPRGFRGTTALSRVVNGIAAEYEIDFAFYDSGPNIGALNRIILLDCDYFAIPAAYDLFSVRAVKTLGHTLANWIRDWDTVAELAPRDVYLLPGKPHLLGYIPQRFRTYGGTTSNEYLKFLAPLEQAVQQDVMAVLSRIDGALVEDAVSPLRLGGVKDFGGLATASQRQGVAMAEVTAGTAEQRATAENAFAEIARRIIERTGRARR